MQHIAYSIAIILSASSNLFLDKTQSQAANTGVAELREEFTELKADLANYKATESGNYKVIDQRMDTFEKQIDKLETNQTKKDEKVDKILFLLLNSQ